MSSEVEVTAVCRWCEASLAPSHIGVCPECGKEGKKAFVSLGGELTTRGDLTKVTSKKVGERIAPRGSLTAFRERRKEFLEENPKFKKINNAISFGSIVLGFVLGLALPGLIGTFVGLILGVVAAVLTNHFGPLAAMKIREVERERVL